MLKTDFSPILADKRIPIIDMLRGWALLGVVLMNYSDLFMMGAGSHYKPDGFTDYLLIGGGILFSSKSWTLLSFLFGYGFAVVIQNIVDKGINYNIFFIKRMFWLFAIAFINSAFFFGDILKDYAFLGIILLLFQRCSARNAIYIALGIFLLIPLVSSLVTNYTGNIGLDILQPYLPLYKSHYLPDVLWFGLISTWKGQVLNLNTTVTVHTVMFCCFLVGLAAKRSAFFENLLSNKHLLKRIWIVTFVLIIVIILLTQLVKRPLLIAHYYNPDYWVVLVIMIFTGTSFCLIYISGLFKGFFIAMQNMGKMTLTNYIIQNIAGLIIFSGFGFGVSLTHRIPLGYSYLLALLVYISQLCFSKWWFIKFRYGPVEWLWRQLSYGKRLTIKLKDT